jgi:hypothetical protein
MPDNTKIFKFKDETGQDIYVDPFEVDARFAKAAMSEDMDLLDRWISDVPRNEETGEVLLDKFSRGQEQLYLEACFRYIPLIRQALKIRPFDEKTGEGMPGEDVLLLWAAYNAWRHGVKKNTGTPPTSSTPTGSESSSSTGSTEPSPVQPPPTSPRSASHMVGPPAPPIDRSAVRRSMDSTSTSGVVIPSQVPSSSR